MRNAVIVCAGKSFDPKQFVNLIKLGDTMVINFAAYPIIKEYPHLYPNYYLTMDDPARFAHEWHLSEKVRSLMNSANLKKAFGHKCKNVQGIKYPGWMKPYDKLKPENKAKTNKDKWETARHKQAKYIDKNPFTDPNVPMFYKSILYATRYLVSSGYTRLFFYGCDFIPDQQTWYGGGVSTSPLDEKKFKGKCHSTEDQLLSLRKWYPHALSMNCKWMSLSKISRLNSTIPYISLDEALKETCQ